MKRFHISIAVSNITQSIADYSKRLGCPPKVFVANEFALWKTDLLNFSIRKTNQASGVVRHIGFEDSTVQEFTEERDINGLLWESFNEQNQLDEIHAIWADNISMEN